MDMLINQTQYWVKYNYKIIFNCNMMLKNIVKIRIYMYLTSFQFVKY